jgi:hypothetical protein
MFYVVIVGLAGALLMFAGDMLLYYTPEDFAYDSKSSSAEKIQAIVDVMKKLPAKRVMAGSSTSTKGNSYYCFRWMDKLDFRYILFGCVVRNSIIISSKRYIFDCEFLNKKYEERCN